MERSRDEAGVPYDPVLATFMVFTVRFPNDGLKDFYTYMKDNGEQSFSFIWSPEFDTSSNGSSAGCLNNFGGAILVNGHIVDIDETLEFPTGGGENKQLQLNVKLLVSNISFAGEKGATPCGLLLRENAPESAKGFSKYALFLTDGDAPTTGVKGGITHSISQVFGSNPEVKAILKNLWYHKRISQPCEIIATLTLTWASSSSMPSRENVKDWFFHKRVQLKVVDKARGIDKVIANNYFVYELFPCYRRSANTSSMDVELHIFSLDKLMTLDKFSKVYTSKRLGNDIFSGSVGKFVLAKYPANKKNPTLMTLKGDFANMQVMPLTTKDKELRIPYAVQYDESFYDFIKRLADRYGEFLYFEDGSLHLGLEPGITNYSRATQTTPGIISSTTTVVINWALEKDLQARYYHHLDAENLTVKDQHSNYLDRKDEDSDCYISSSETAKYFNPDPVPADENLDIMPKEGGRTMGELYEYAEWRKLLMWDLFKIFSAKSLMQAFADIMSTELFRVWKLGYKYEKRKADFIETHYSPYEDDKKNSKYPGHTSDTSVMQFGTLAGNTDFATTFDQEELKNLTSVFFSALRKMERKVTEDAVTLEFGENTQPFSLGDKIQVDSIDYIVIDIEGRADKHENGFEDVQKVTAIPVYIRTKDSTTTSVVIPPLQPGIQIRESKPQRAFIDDTDDPEELGRVRIRYPWQKKGDDASPWIRVTLPMATDGGAVNFTPGEGDEAMVDYENGNIDRPYVTGYVMSPYNKSKWGNPSLPERGIVSANGHSLTFDDGSDGSNFFWGWLPTLETAKTLLPPSWWGDWLKNKDAGMKALVGGFTLTDRYGLYEVSGSSDGRSVSVKSPMGDISLSAFTGIKISAPNGDINITGKNVTIKAGNKLTLTSGNNLKDRYIDREVKINNLANFGVGLLNNISEKTLESLLDFSFLRCVLEVFARPVDGTLKIKSNTHVMVEAGKGSVQVPRSFYNNAPSDILSDKDMQEQGLLLPVVLKTVEVIKTEVNAFVDNFKTAFETYNTAYQALENVRPTYSDRDRNGKALPFDKIKDKAFALALNTDISGITINDDDFDANEMVEVKASVDQPQDPSADPNWDNLDENMQDALRDIFIAAFDEWYAEYEPIRVRHESMVADYKRLGKDLLVAIFNLRKGYDTANLPRIIAFDENKMVKGIADDKLGGFLEFVHCPLTKDMINDKDRFPEVIAAYNGWKDEKKFLKRKIVYKMLRDDAATYTYTPPPIDGVPQPAVTVKVKDVFKVRVNAPQVTDFTDDTQWSAFTKEIFVANNDFEPVEKWVMEHYGQNYADLDNLFNNITWNPKAKGRILFSDNPSKTVSIVGPNVVAEKNIEALAIPVGPEISRILGELE